MPRAPLHTADPHISTQLKLVHRFLSKGSFGAAYIVTATPEGTPQSTMSADESLARLRAAMPPASGGIALRCAPLVHATIDDDSWFVLPGAADAQTCFLARAARAEAPSDDGDDDELALALADLPVAQAAPLYTLAHSLEALLACLDASPALYTLGASAAAVARELLARGAGGQSPRRAALVLIDRDCDLAAVALHADNAMDCVFASLPRACAAHADASPDPPLPPGGSLAHPCDAGAQRLLSALMRADITTGARLCADALASHAPAAAARLAAGADGTAVVEYLRSATAAAAASDSARALPLVDTLCLALPALHGECADAWRSAVALERATLVAASPAAAPGASGLRALGEAVGLAPRPAAARLCVALFSLLGTRIGSAAELRVFSAALAAAGVAPADWAAALARVAERRVRASAAAGATAGAAARGSNAAAARRGAAALPAALLDPTTLRPQCLVAELARALFAPAPGWADAVLRRADAPAPISALLASLWGGGGGSSSGGSDRVCHFELVILCFVGGVAASEVAAVREAVRAQAPRATVLVGGTCVGAGPCAALWS